MKYILALDQGTTSSRAILFDEYAQIVAMEQKEFTQYYPQAGWVEHDPMEIWNTQISCARACLTKAGIQASQVSAIGVTNQRETTVIWDNPLRQLLCGKTVVRQRFARTCSAKGLKF